MNRSSAGALAAKFPLIAERQACAQRSGKIAALWHASEISWDRELTLDGVRFTGGPLVCFFGCALVLVRDDVEAGPYHKEARARQLVITMSGLRRFNLKPETRNQKPPEFSTAPLTVGVGALKFALHVRVGFSVCARGGSACGD